LEVLFCCSFYLHVAVYIVTHDAADIVGWLVVGWLQRCIFVKQQDSRTDGLDAWYSDWPQPTTHCVEIGDFRLTVHVGISGVLTNTSH